MAEALPSQLEALRGAVAAFAAGGGDPEELHRLLRAHAALLRDPTARRGRDASARCVDGWAARGGGGNG